MRGSDENSGALFSYIDLEERVPVRHPLRTIRRIVNDALANLDAEINFRGEKRSHATHASTTDPDARLYEKSPGSGAMLCFIGLTVSAVS